VADSKTGVDKKFIRRFFEGHSPVFLSMIACHLVGSYCMGSFRYYEYDRWGIELNSWLDLVTEAMESNDKGIFRSTRAVALDFLTTFFLCLHSLTGFFSGVQVHQKSSVAGWRRLISYRIQGLDKARPLRTLSYMLYFVVLIGDPTKKRWWIVDVLRVVRLIWFIGESPQLVSTLQTLYWNWDTLVTLLAILSYVVFVFVTLGREIFSEMKYGEFLRDGADFSTFYSSFMILFRLISGDEWNKIARATWIVEPFCTYETDEDALLSRGM
jgi:hypothetical protein